MKPDKEYENAIRHYLDSFFNLNEEIIIETDNDTIDLNVVKPLCGYIIKKTHPEFQFATPMYAWWDLTSACNFRCIHCLYNETPYDSSNDLTDEESLALADALINDFRIAQIVLTGGEVFLRPKLLIQLVEKFKSNNIGITIATNAALIQKEHIDFLGDALNTYTDRLQISLDGATPATFKKIRKTDTFFKIINNIEALTDKDIRITVVSTVNKINYNEIIDTYDLCNRLGAYDFAANKMLVYNDIHKQLCITDKESVLLAHRLLEAKKGKQTLLKLGLFNNIQLLNMDYVDHILKEDKYKTVLKNISSIPLRSCNRNDRISIRSDGSVYMCMEAQCPSGFLGNLREQSLQDIWAGRASNIFFQPRLIENMGCKYCSYKNICNSGCMVRAYKNTGSLNNPESSCKFCKTTCINS